ncbi:hypothetical protein J2T58_001726 [Methanocalculus alkaliphilus]|nr:hypothetical protein [Methanocalculus alkaliphilus]
MVSLLESASGRLFDLIVIPFYDLPVAASVWTDAL